MYSSNYLLVHRLALEISRKLSSSFALNFNFVILNTRFLAIILSQNVVYINLLRAGLME